jgi:hypothetical protein
MSEKQKSPNLARRSLLSGLGTAAVGGLIANATAAVKAPRSRPYAAAECP